MKRVFLFIVGFALLLGALSRCSMEAEVKPATASQTPPDRLKDI